VSANSLITTEASGTVVFSLALDSQPSNDVNVFLSSSNSAEGSVSAASLEFTDSDWSIYQTVTVTGVDDWLVDGNNTFSIMTTVASLDANFDNATLENLQIVNNDGTASPSFQLLFFIYICTFPLFLIYTVPCCVSCFFLLFFSSFTNLCAAIMSR
jgi:hypothetical protein